MDTKRINALSYFNLLPVNGGVNGVSPLDSPIPVNLNAAHETLDIGFLTSIKPPAPFTFERRIRLRPIYRYGENKTRQPTRSISYYTTAYNHFLKQRDRLPSDSVETLNSSVLAANFGEFLINNLRQPPFIATKFAELHRNQEISQLLQSLSEEMHKYEKEIRKTKNERNPICVAMCLGKIRKIYESLGFDFTIKTSHALLVNLTIAIRPFLHLLSRNEIALIGESLRLIYLGQVLRHPY